MKVYVDGDGCPVVKNTVKICTDFKTECIIVCDSAHNISFENAKTVTVSKGADSADFALVNMIEPPCIVITQDYGLAAMCMAKGAKVINQDGFLYTKENIDGLLFYRYEAKKLRAQNKRHGRIPKRTDEKNKQFENSLINFLSKP